MLRQALTVITIVAAAIIAWPVYLVMVLGSRRANNDYNPS